MGEEVARREALTLAILVPLEHQAVKPVDLAIFVWANSLGPFFLGKHLRRWTQGDSNP